MSESGAAPSMPVADDDWVRAFVRGRDVPCPRCGYCLRDLVDARCPECAEPLVLRVGVVTPRFGWLVAAMAPGLFSIVCATLLAVPLIAFRNAGNNGPPAPMYFAELFGITSFLVAIGIYRKRHRFLAWSRVGQIWVAVTIWTAHILAFGLLLLLMN